MCQSKADGGRRCAGTPAGRALHALYRERRASTHPDEVTERIERLKTARARYGSFVSPFTMELPGGVDAALDTARRVGNPLIVGGAVRDAHLGATSKDTDVEVYGVTLDTLTEAFRRDGFAVDEVGKAFGVLKVSKKGVVRDLDVAVPRTENANGAGHRGFTVDTDTTMTVADAAARRDFTINAMSYDPALGVLLDPYSGAADMESRTLRAVSDKFAEDPLRVLRGMQFAARFGMSLHPDTAAMCRTLRPRYGELATERVAEEWTKLWTKSTRPSLGLTALRDAGWDDTAPGLRDALTDDLVRQMDYLAEIDAFDRPATGAAAVASAMPPELRRAFITTTTIGNDTARLAAALCDTNSADLDTRYARKHWARKKVSTGFTFTRYRAFAHLTDNIDALRVCDEAFTDGVLDAPEPPLIQGRDILALAGDRKPGPWTGKLVNAALDAQYRGQFRDKNDALNWVREQLEG